MIKYQKYIIYMIKYQIYHWDIAKYLLFHMIIMNDMIDISVLIKT